MIHVNCPDCGRSYLLSPKTQGKQATCKECGSRFAIPVQRMKAGLQAGLGAKRRPADTSSRVKQLLELLDRMEEFPHPRASLGYRVHLVFVAGMMLLLPLLYFAFVAGVAWLTWWHATHNHVWMSAVYGVRAAIFLGILYVGLIIAGSVWVLSLIKPIFVRIRQQPGSGGLSREDEPALFAFADRLADLVGAPRPEILYFQLDANAGATYSTASFGLRRKGFTLILGIPLIAGLTLPQLAGVMAHEFGHFSQRGSSLLMRAVRRVNLWFAVAVHRHDWIDDMIETLTESRSHAAFEVFLGFMMWILVGLGRIVLWLLMQVGLLVSASLMRRAEFDADRYEIALVGSKAFEQSTKRLAALNLAHAVAAKHVFDSSWGDHLPKDFTGFIVGLADSSRKIQKKVARRMKETGVHLLATHPPDAARIAAARRLEEPGVLKSDLPGSALILNFEKKCAALTREMYEWRFGGAFVPETLRPTREAVQGYLNTMERG